MTWIRRIIRGCTDHPGTDVLVAFLLMGGLAGAKGGISGFFGGVIIMAVFIVPIYGALERGKANHD